MSRNGKSGWIQAQERMRKRIDPRPSISPADRQREDEDVIVHIGAHRGNRLRCFDPASETKCDVLRAQIRDLEIRLPLTNRKRTRRSLFSQLRAAKAQLASVEASLRITAA